ncbi:TerC family protein [Endozoicomonas numazuensis]|uniref:Membrane protein n=1 Tax=Endozoicomonas numazuensis TaxID=1137799 RepID=A0A081NFG2_9GAMM|nr:TerC family protein [Endozoicomonas numazuensis]KEQ17185.1 membrane protein [Endozoicomonas numazuensis]
MTELLLTPEPWIALATLTILEIILGIDNIIFITIVVDKLPEHQRNSARRLGLLLAMFTRIALLLSITWIMSLTVPLFHLFDHAISGRDLILLGGGLFLLAKSTHEIHDSIEPGEDEGPNLKPRGYVITLVQIALIDIVFSLDSVITAVGLAEHLWVMVTAIIISVGIMMFAAAPIGEFVSNHPTFKMLALSFLILVGVSLMGEGLDFHIPKGYIYFAMAFSLAVEMLNSRLRSRQSGQ